MWLFRNRVLASTPIPGRRSDDGNLRTQIAIARRDPTVDFGALYRACYPRLREAALAADWPGVLVVGVDIARRELVAAQAIAARTASIATAIVGRHSEADLFLPDDAALALRQLVVVVEPPRSFSPGDVRVRVIDLRTGKPPRDEEGRSVESLTAEGPVFLSLGRYALMIFPTGDPTDWPAEADNGWRCLPERVFVEERLASGSVGSAPRPHPEPVAAALASRAHGAWLGQRTTVVSRHEGPVEAQTALLAEGEDASGTLVVAGRELAVRFTIGHEAARRGLLVGRYDRCHGNTRTAVTSDRVSRVHLLVLEVAGRMHAIDLGTTNGTFIVRDDALETTKATRLDDGKTLALANDKTRVWWESVGE